MPMHSATSVSAAGVSVLKVSERVCLTAACMCAQAEWVKELHWSSMFCEWRPIKPLTLPPDALTDALDAGWWYSLPGGRARSCL